MARKGEKYTCEECGVMVTVDEPCGCVTESHFICCGTPMKPVKPKAKKK
jgi:hypothetical protein